MTLAEQIAEVVAAQDFGTPSAAKRGRNPKFPYVPVVKIGEGMTANANRGLAFATREEAIRAAENTIAYRRKLMAETMAGPHGRALRRQYGLPLEL